MPPIRSSSDSPSNGLAMTCTWSGITTPTPRWEQAFSDDDGATWETNWVMEFTRALEVAA